MVVADLVHYRLRVVLLDGRQLIGELLAFDKYMNIVLADTEEFRATRKSLVAAKKAASSGDSSTNIPPIRETKRALGLIILRGETIISVSVEAPPRTVDPAARLGGIVSSSDPSNAGVVAQGQGFAKPINRAPSATLAAPARTSAASFFGGGSAGSGVPPGFQPPPGFGGR